MDFEITRQRLIDVRVVHINGIQVGFHLQQIEWDHLAAELLGRLILEEPSVVVRLSVQELVHLVLFSLYLIGDLLTVLENHLFSLLSSHIDGEQLL